MASLLLFFFLSPTSPLTLLLVTFSTNITIKTIREDFYAEIGSCALEGVWLMSLELGDLAFEVKLM